MDLTTLISTAGYAHTVSSQRPAHSCNLEVQ